MVRSSALGTASTGHSRHWAQSVLQLLSHLLHCILCSCPDPAAGNTAVDLREAEPCAAELKCSRKHSYHVASLIPDVACRALSALPPIDSRNVDVELNVHCILYNNIVCYHKQVTLPRLAPTLGRGTTCSQEAADTGCTTKFMVTVFGCVPPTPPGTPLSPSPLPGPSPWPADPSPGSDTEGTGTVCNCISCSECAAYCRAYVEDNLTASFRSYAAVTPHDWQAYEEMRSLALDKHGLHIGAIDLPLQASDQSKSLSLLMLQGLHTSACANARYAASIGLYSTAYSRLSSHRSRCEQGLK